MSAPRFSRVQKATALIPLALLSAAWTLTATGLDSSSNSATAQSPTSPPVTLPDGTELPQGLIDDPATVADGLLADAGDVADASASGIPAAALTAYQRAATVINEADRGCNIEWQLIAAIGMVESHHGRANGNALNAEGLAVPGIFGLPLNGDGVARIVDTDGGQYDGDTRFDRAVGPMQFIPSTWSAVGVDADSDGSRNPQDIDDAALGAAVYLCSGDADLSTDAGRREAVYRYNHSQEYVEKVLAIYEAYLRGDYTEAPNGTITSTDDTIQTKKQPGDGPVRKGGDPSPGDRPDRRDDEPTGGSGQPPVEAPPQRKPTEKPAGADRPASTDSDADSTLRASTTVLRDGSTEVGAAAGTVLATPARIADACRAELEARYGTSNAEAVGRCVQRVGEVTVESLSTSVSDAVTGLGDVLRGLLGLTGGILGTLTGQN